MILFICVLFSQGASLRNRDSALCECQMFFLAGLLRVSVITQFLEYMCIEVCSVVKSNKTQFHFRARNGDPMHVNKEGRLGSTVDHRPLHSLLYTRDVSEATGRP
jgi:hypothetical protein